MIVNQQKVTKPNRPTDRNNQTGTSNPIPGIQAQASLTSTGLEKDVTTTTSSINPSQARRDQAGFNGSLGADIPDATEPPPSGPTVGFAGQEKDWRVRLSVSPESEVLYRNPGDAGILNILRRTDGVIFPYVPQITINHNANYSQQNLTHANYRQYFYESSSVDNIQINGDFTAQTSDDARYLLAAIHFFRSATKMFYGDSGQYQGSPPPILYLDGYGKHYLPHVPCVVTYFSQMLPNDVDYINAEVFAQDPTEEEFFNGGGSDKTRVPTACTLMIQLQPVYSRIRQKEFSFDKFAAGALINKGFI